jgi:hypothetical protein
MSGFPKKFESLVETKLGDIETPDYVWLTYSVCVMEENSCGWGGWLIEGAFKKTAKKFPTGTGDKALPAVDKQICPQCGKVLFRTEASVKLKPMEDV